MPHALSTTVAESKIGVYDFRKVAPILIQISFYIQLTDCVDVFRTKQVQA